MKYLYIILAIVSLATILSLLSFLPGKKTSQDDIAITINGHDIGQGAVASEGKKFGYHSEQQAELFDTLITRELLLQEAQRQAIDKEESFRESLKNYYENSLIKILLDRQNSKIEAAANDADVANYISFLGKIVTFTRLDTIPDSAAEIPAAKGLTNTALFTDLAMPVRLLLSSLKPGQFAIKFDTGTEKYALRLDAVQPAPDYMAKNIDRRHIAEILAEQQKEQQMNRWLSELKQKATITFHNPQE
jgi:hypothetical protein